MSVVLQRNVLKLKQLDWKWVGLVFGSTLRLFLFQHHYTSGIPERSPFFPRLYPLSHFTTNIFHSQAKRAKVVVGAELLQGESGRSIKF